MKKSFLVVEVENGYIIQPYTPYLSKTDNEKAWIAKDFFDVMTALVAAFESDKSELKKDEDMVPAK